MIQEFDGGALLILLVYLFFFFRWIGKYPTEELREGPRPHRPPVARQALDGAPRGLRPAGAATAADDVKRALSRLSERDATFDEGFFLNGAVKAYERIVTAFGDADLNALAGLTSADVRDAFATEIAGRAPCDSETVPALVKTDAATIIGVEAEGSRASITVRFASQFLVQRPRRGDDGAERSEADLINAVDEWTFARTIGCSDPNWTLIATQSA